MRILLHPSINAHLFESLNAFRFQWYSISEEERRASIIEARAWIASFVISRARECKRLNRRTIAWLLQNVSLN